MSAEPRTAGTSSRSVRKILLGIAAALALVALAGGVVWAVNCPCERTPGFVLLGDTHEAPVADWSFANDVSLCQIQIGIWLRPHSVNVNCMATPDRNLHQLLGRREQVLVSTGGTGPLGTPAARRRRLPRRPQPRDGPGQRSIGSGPHGSASCRSRKCRRGSPGAAARPPPLDTPRPDSWWTVAFGERQLHGDTATGNLYHQLLGRREQVLVSTGGTGMLWRVRAGLT